MKATTIKERIIYDVVHDNEVKTFVSLDEACNYKHQCELSDYYKYLDELGIPRQGIYLVVSDRLWACGDCPAVIMYNGKCVASLNVNPISGAKYYCKGTEWSWSHCCSDSFKYDDFIKRIPEFIPIWDSTFDKHNGAYHYYWGKINDGMTEFYYQIGYYNTKNEVHVTKLQ